MNNDKLYNSIKHNITSITPSFAHELFKNRKTNGNFIYLAKGGQGVVYKYSDFAVKIIKSSSFSPSEKSVMTIVRNELHDNPNFIKIYDIINKGHYVLIIMDLADGNLSEWMKNNHTDCEWISMIFQIVMMVNTMQKIKMYHSDMKPKNILFKKINTQLEYSDINFKTNYLFILSDFGMATTISQTGKYTKEAINAYIHSNADLYELSSIYKRLLVDEIIKKYSTEELIKYGNKNDYFKTYYETEKNKINENLKNFDNSMKDKMLKRSIAYFLVEKNMIKYENQNTPSKKITDLLDTFVLNDMKTIINDSQKLLKELC